MSVRLFAFLVHSVRQNLSKKSRSKIPVLQSHRRLTTMTDVSTEVDVKKNGISETNIISDKKNTRYRKRQLKRTWEESTRKKKDSDESEEKKPCEPYQRIKKKKMAMLLGYSGVNYYGMQRNPGVPTIEEDLLKALLEAKYITEEDFANQQNAQFQRSSRTDKGVSAARQVVSLKLPLEVNIEEINSKLPPCIKVFGIKRATNRFNSKSKCNARTYSYTLPTYVFEPSIKREEDRKAYRITAEKTTKVNEVLAVYKGTKSYHNFTEKKHYQDPSALRFMMSFSMERVFMECEMEFAELLVKGQSFMLHQIRKMIGLMIAIVRGETDMSTLEKAFTKEKVMIPTAPGLGLVLDKVHYERYDAKFKSSHDSLTWEEVEEVVQKFKHEQIFPSIVKGEIEDNSMGIWLEKLAKHSYEPSEDVPEEKNDGDCEDVGDDDDEDCNLDNKKDIDGQSDTDGSKEKQNSTKSNADEVCRGDSNLENREVTVSEKIEERK